MGTTDEIRDKLLQNPELAELLRERREPDETVDEGALVYLEVRARCPAGPAAVLVVGCVVVLARAGGGCWWLVYCVVVVWLKVLGVVAQMLRPRPKSPPRFVD